MSVTTDTSLEEEDIDDLWDQFERINLQNQRRGYQYAPPRSSRRTDSQFTASLDSDTEYPYSSDSDFIAEHVRKSRVSAGPNGVPLVDFPVPRGVDADALVTGEGGVDMADLLLKCCGELRDGTRAGRDLLRTMRLREVIEGEEQGMGEGETDTVRLVGRSG
jgi:protein-serine/threonine kinase